jgi:hypothetical protein
MAHGYLQHARDWGITWHAIIRLSSRLARAFTYGELNTELEEHDHLRIDGRGYAGALEAVAQHTRRSEPLWTAMVINADTGRPGDGLWKANPDDRRYADAGTLSERRRKEWLDAQRAWCIAAARVRLDPLDQQLREHDAGSRERANSIFIDLLMRDRADEREGSE